MARIVSLIVSLWLALAPALAEGISIPTLPTASRSGAGVAYPGCAVNGPTTWSTSDKSAAVSLSNSNLTATFNGTTAVDAAIRGSTCRYGNLQLYAEFTMNVGSGVGDAGAGIGAAYAQLSSVGLNPVGAFEAFRSGNVYINGAFSGVNIGGLSNGSVLGMAVDLIHKTGWFRKDNGNWNGSSSANPVTNVGGVDLSTVFPGNAAFLLASFYTNGDVITVNPGSSAFANAAPVGFSPWDPAAPITDLLLGSGGNVPDASPANDGTYVIQTDVFGGYLWCSPSGALSSCSSTTAPNGTAGTFQQLVSQTSMPATFAANGINFNDGPWSLKVCPTNSQTMYMVYLAYPLVSFTLQSTVYKSTDGGAHWTATNFTPVSQLSGNVSTWKQYGAKMAVGSVFAGDCNRVVVSTFTNVLISSDGGSTWSTVSTGQLPASTNGYAGIVIDPTNNANIYAAILGSGVGAGAGVYKSTNGGVNWTLLTAGTGPSSNVLQADIDPNTGNYFAVEASTFGPLGENLWLWNGSTWSQVLTNGGGVDNNVSAIAIDTSTAGHIFAIAGHGEINESTNSGSAWSGWSSSSGVTMSTSGDVGWTPSLGLGVFQPNMCFHDRLTAKTIHCATQQSFITTTPWSGSISTSTNINWNNQGRGIEEVVATTVMSSPQYAIPFLAFWDWTSSHPSSFSSYPAALLDVGDAQSLSIGYSIDYDPTLATNTVCVVGDGAVYSVNINKSGCTTNGTAWTKWPNLPSIVWPTNTNIVANTNIAMSSATNILLGVTGQQPVYTTNATAGTITWNNIGACAGVTWSNFMPGNSFNGGYNQRSIASDRVTAGKFYLYVSGTGFFVLTASGATCTAGAAITSTPGGGGGSSINNSMQMRGAPGIAGELWVSVGFSGSPGGPPTTVGGLMYSTNSASTFTTITNIAAASALGFGCYTSACQTANGLSHPTVIVAGWHVDNLTGQSFTIGNSGTASITIPAGLNLAANTALTFENGVNFQYALVQSYNNATGALVLTKAASSGSGAFSTWILTEFGVWQCSVSCNSGSTPAWKQLVGWAGQPSTIDFITTVDGDASVFNRAYVGFAGSGFQRFN